MKCQKVWITTEDYGAKVYEDVELVTRTDPQTGEITQIELYEDGDLVALFAGNEIRHLETQKE
jgi:hypothetical protein